MSAHWKVDQLNGGGALLIVDEQLYLEYIHIFNILTMYWCVLVSYPHISIL